MTDRTVASRGLECFDCTATSDSPCFGALWARGVRTQVAGFGRMSGAVFISYASQDMADANRLCQAISATGIDVWFDQSELRGGDAWDQKIRLQIRECSLFVPVISANTQARNEGYFRREWRLAVERTHDMADHVSFLLPIVLDDVPDKEARVPDAFRDIQWTRMQRGGQAPSAFTESAKRLIHGVAASLKPTLPRMPTAAPVVPAIAPKSVAVLAFANRSDEKENEYFSDGISEDLINALGKVPGLKVSARTSAFFFKGKDMPIVEIAQRLGVAYVVEGSVRKVGGRARITVQLIKAVDGFHAWGDTFTRDVKDIFAVQDEIAGLIANSLALKLGGHSRARVMNPEAIQLLWKGREVLNRSFDDSHNAIPLLEAALLADKESAETWASLASAYNSAAALGAAGPAPGFEKARHAALQAIFLDPELGLGYDVLGVIQFAYDFDWAAATKTFQKALALTPGNASVLSNLSTIAQIVGRRERAIELGMESVDLDPLNSRVCYVLGKALFQDRRYEELEAHANRMIAMNPAVFYGHVFRVYARLFLGKPADAGRAADEVPHEFFRLICIAHARFAEGRVEESDSVLREAEEKHGDSAAYQIANVYGRRGDRDNAFRWLEISLRMRDPGLTWLKNDGFMDSLRTDPRWSAFMRRMKLEDDQLAQESVLWSF
jgi:adenylate cyclase